MPILGSAAAPSTTDDYVYVYNGLTLNPLTTQLPFLDVTKVSGLDLPDVDAAINDIDGRNGATVYAQYTGARTVSIEGTVYALPANIETYIDQIITAFMPRSDDLPFYFKHPGVAQRYIKCRPTGVKLDTDTLRRTGQGEIQIQLSAADPLKYINNVPIIPTSGTTYTVTNAGNVTTYPITTVTGKFTSIWVSGVGSRVTFTYTTTSDTDVTVVDCANKIVTINGTQMNQYAVLSVGTDWPSNTPGNSNYRVDIFGGTATASGQTFNGWM